MFLKMIIINDYILEYADMLTDSPQYNHLVSRGHVHDMRLVCILI